MYVGLDLAVGVGEADVFDDRSVGLDLSVEGMEVSDLGDALWHDLESV